MIFQAKLEYDKTLNSTPVNSKARIGPEGIKVAPRSAFKRELLSNHLLRDRFGLLKDQLTDFPGFMLGIKDPSMKSNGLRNPFDIPRHSLLDQLVRMRANFLQVSRDPQILVSRARVGDLLCHLAKYDSHSIFLGFSLGQEHGTNKFCVLRKLSLALLVLSVTLSCT